MGQSSLQEYDDGVVALGCCENSSVSADIQDGIVYLPDGQTFHGGEPYCKSSTELSVQHQHPPRALYDSPAALYQSYDF